MTQALRPTRRAVLAGTSLAMLAACATDTIPGQGAGSTASTRSGATPAETSSSPMPPSSTQATPTSSTPDHRARAQAMTPQARVGQLIMMGHSSSQLDGRTRELIEEHQLGSLLLLGDSLGSRQELAVFTSALSGVDIPLPILVAADQEGGDIQRLRGTGFSRIPPATEQAELSPQELQEQWTTWGRELARVGVRYNLAPVADLVPAENVARNAPIGKLRRHYGTSIDTVSSHVEAAIKGMSAAGMATSAKHFPGLGRVGTNTDFGAATDTVTGIDDPALAIFRRAITAGATSIMISSATYTRIDPDHQAVFSSRIITDLLRGTLGYDKVVISDDLGVAASVSHLPPGERATRFLQAGGDLVITADPTLVSTMTEAILDLTTRDEGFADQLIDKTARVLALKELS